jgi:hypothetical protein
MDNEFIKRLLAQIEKMQEKPNLSKAMKASSLALKTSDDRTFFIVFCSLIDDFLSDMLEAFFIADIPKNVLRSTVPNSLSGKANLCYALGLVDLMELDILDFYRKVRNVFAHDWETESLSNPNPKLEALLQEYRHMLSAIHVISKSYSKQNGREPDLGSALRWQAVVEINKLSMRPYDIADNHRLHTKFEFGAEYKLTAFEYFLGQHED